MVDTHYLCIHCHYYQPPRGNPFDGDELIEPDAAPYKNWNERITAECYRPNATIGNFDAVSFNLGATLAAWLADHAGETYERIMEADRRHREAYGVGNAIAQGMHHTILPLDRREDKVTQVKWGKAVFEHRFGRPTTGMWLPEMAVDIETMEVLAEQGIQWTILTESQVDGHLTGAGPYRVRLPDGQSIKVFVRDEHLSNDIAFNLGRFGGAGRWGREVLVPRKRDAGPLTLIATDGETFGHHWPSEEHFLHWLLTYEANAAGYEIVTLARYAEMVEPIGELTIRENTAWSCHHGLKRWATGCGCTPGDSSWKGAVRRALDNVRHHIDDAFVDAVESLPGEVNPHDLRDAYIEVVLGQVAPADFIESRRIDLPSGEADDLLKLVEAQFYRQRMYSSCTFFFEQLTALTTLYGIANAAYAIKLTAEVTGKSFDGEFRRDLSVATAPGKDSSPISGAELYDQILTMF